MRQQRKLAQSQKTEASDAPGLGNAGCGESGSIGINWGNERGGFGEKEEIQRTGTKGSRCVGLGARKGTGQREYETTEENLWWKSKHGGTIKKKRNHARLNLWG